MKNDSFQDILEQLIDKDSPLSTSDFTSKNRDLYNNTQESFFKSSSESIQFKNDFSDDLSTMISELSQHSFKGAQLSAAAFGRKHYDVRRNATINSYRPTMTIPAHTMNEIQKKAYDSLLYAMNLPILTASRLLPLSFTADDLKKSFKKAALQCHPDTGGHHETFLSLKKNYEILKQLVMTT